jgi:hypothetical protein
MKRTTMFLVAVVAGLGCSIETEEVGDVGDEDMALEPEDEILEIVENLRRAGYPEQEIEVRDDVVIVGGDAEVSLQASREMIGLAGPEPEPGVRGGEGRDVAEREGDEAFRQYRTLNLVGTGIDTICINGAAFTGTLSTALDNAIASYNNMNLWFNMWRTNGPAPGCDALITGFVVPGNGGLAGFPSFGFPFTAINIGSGVASFGLPVATHVMTHELGHCIGFRHTDFGDRAVSCGIPGNEGGGFEGAIHIPGTPWGAVYNGSVMNACFNGGSTGVWTGWDVRALQETYGNSCQDTGSCGGMTPSGCWCDAACINYGDCCFDGPCTTPDPHSCFASGACGGQAPGGCWCDAACAGYDDCCADAPC